jgi:hypothetical protein
VPGIVVGEVTGNPFQPDVQFRGFVASPVAGTPQGLAVYQNGVRINEAFGDMVHWDLIPTAAIRSVTVVTNNPAFGLNALGGAVNVQMKNGFNYRGAEADTMGGSFGRMQSSAQWGKQVDNFSLYGALEALHDDGFRNFSTSNVRRFYGDVGYKNDVSEVHINMGVADNNFGAAATVPIELLQQYYGATYTTPQTSTNRVGFFNLTGKKVSDINRTSCADCRIVCAEGSKLPCRDSIARQNLDITAGIGERAVGADLQGIKKSPVHKGVAGEKDSATVQQPGWRSLLRHFRWASHGVRRASGSLLALFRKDLGDKVRRHHSGRAREGKFAGALTYGYRLIPGKPGEREIDQDQAKVVLRIFTEFASGRSASKIAADLTREGIPSPSGGAHWNHQTFVGGTMGRRGMIGNQLYVGKLVWNANRTVLNPETRKRTQQRGNPDEVIVTDVPHLRIVPQSLWDQVHGLCDERAARFGHDRKARRRVVGKDHLLSGMLRCGAWAT